MFSIELTAIAIDDEPYVLKYFERQLLEVKNLTLLRSFTKMKPALDFLAAKGRVNIVFSDIEMEDGGGIGAASALSAHSDYLIFVTGYPEYALKSYEVGADAFLRKPVLVEQIQAKVDKLCKLLEGTSQAKSAPQSIFVHDGLNKVDYRIAVDEIIELCSNGNYVDIITTQKKVTEHTTLKAWQSSMEGTGRFIRVSRSVIVAKEFIVHIQENIVYLHNGSCHAIGRTYQKALRDYMNANLRNNLMK